VFSFAKERAPFSQHMLNHRAPRKDEGTFISAHGGHKDITIKKRELRTTTKYVAISHFTFLSLNQNKNLFYSIKSPTLMNDASPSMSPIFLNNVSPSD
jgi:hypothetical protein